MQKKIKKTERANFAIFIKWLYLQKEFMLI